MILTVAILLAGAGTGYAQSQDANSRKMARKQMKAEQDARDRLAFEEARKAIEAKEFVLEADQVSFKSGSTAQVSSNTNFVAVQGDKAVVQVAFDIPVSGPNGLGQHLGLQAERGQEGEHPCVDERHRHGDFRTGLYQPS